MDWGAAGACSPRPLSPGPARSSPRLRRAQRRPALQAAAASPPVETGAHPVAGKEIVRGVAPEKV